ncbi:MAG: NIL domain-containing protein [Actinomycetota bacterium]
MAASRFHLTFTGNLAKEPVMHTLGQKFDLVPTIRKASLDEDEGWMIIEVDGPEASVIEAVKWLTDQGVKVESINGVV